MQQRANWARLTRPTTPDQLLLGLVDPAVSFAAGRIVGCHFFPFGNFPGTAAWATAVAEGRFTIQTDGVIEIGENKAKRV
jgi:hypothetical protein